MLFSVFEKLLLLPKIITFGAELLLIFKFLNIMNKIIFNFLVLTGVLLFFSCGKEPNLAAKLFAELDPKAAPNTLTEKEQQAGWQLLFDGATTQGLHGYNMQGIPDVWAIEDGCFTVNGEGGGEEQDVITDGVYRNFAFTVEYKLSKGSNSGIIFQIKEDTLYQYPFETGPEFQLIDHENWYEPLEDWQIHGANYAMYPPLAKPYNPVGEWNRLLLVVKENHVTQIINGVIVVVYEKYSDEWVQLRNSGKWAHFPNYGIVDEGRISLQNHGTKLWFRNIKIKTF